MQAHNADIEAANKHRNVILVRRFHAASLIPRGKEKARHPMGLMIFPYFLYMLAIYPSPLNDSQSGYIVFEEHSIPASRRSSSSFPIRGVLII